MQHLASCHVSLFVLSGHRSCRAFFSYVVSCGVSCCILCCVRCRVSHVVLCVVLGGVSCAVLCRVSPRVSWLVVSCHVLCLSASCLLWCLWSFLMWRLACCILTRLVSRITYRASVLVSCAVGRVESSCAVCVCVCGLRCCMPWVLAWCHVVPGRWHWRERQGAEQEKETKKNETDKKTAKAHLHCGSGLLPGFNFDSDPEHLWSVTRSEFGAPVVAVCAATRPRSCTLLLSGAASCQAPRRPTAPIKQSRIGCEGRLSAANIMIRMIVGFMKTPRALFGCTKCLQEVQDEDCLACHKTPTYLQNHIVIHTTSLHV